MLQVNEIFLSVSGEVGLFRQGEWAVFVRLAGCNLRCKWCDTARAQETVGPLMSIEQVVDAVREYGIPRVIVTGGEPLMQEDTTLLALALYEHGFQVQVETNGSFVKPREWIGLEPSHLCVVMDFKTPSSGMTGYMHASFWKSLGKNDWLKFVIQTEQDYETAKRLILDYPEISPSRLAFSACSPMTHASLYEQMKRDGLVYVVLNVQIHKLAGLIKNPTWSL